MTFVSYAQNFEDVMLWRALKHVKAGFYIDIGAQHPIIDSVSRGFYEQGWRGFDIEPVATYAEMLRTDRPENHVLQVAVSNVRGMSTFFSFGASDNGLSTLERDVAEHHQQNGFAVEENVIPTIILDDVFTAAGDREIHWLKIDVEGHERQILEGWNDTKRPWIVVLESTKPLSTTLNYEKWEYIILEKQYHFVYDDGINRFYVHNSCESLKDSAWNPPNFYDDFVLDGISNTRLCVRLHHFFSDYIEQEQKKSASREAALQEDIESLTTQFEKRLAEAVKSYDTEIAFRSELQQLLHEETGEIRRELSGLAGEIKHLSNDNAQHEARQAAADMQRLEHETRLFAILDEERREREAQMSAADMQRLEHEARLYAILDGERREREAQMAAAEERETAYLTLVQRRDDLLAEQAIRHAQLERMLTDLRHELAAKTAPLFWLSSPPFKMVAWFFGMSRQMASLRATPSPMQSRLTEPPASISLPAFKEPLASHETKNMSNYQPKGNDATFTVEDLLAPYDEAFVRNIYQILLLREPDPAGFHHYLARVRRGMNRAQILAEIATSAEARHKAVPVLGLRAMIRSYKIRKIPLLGWLLYRNLYEERISEKLRAIENTLFASGQRHQADVYSLNRSIQDLREQMQHMSEMILQCVGSGEKNENAPQAELTVPKKPQSAKFQIESKTTNPHISEILTQLATAVRGAN